MTNKNDKILAPIKGRIIQFIEKQGIEKKVFFEKLDVASSNFRGKALFSEISADIVAKILSIYPDSNPEWLLTGSGDMLKSKQNQPSAGPTDDKYVAMLEENNELLKKNNCSLEKINTLQEEITQLRAEIQALKSVKSQSVRVNQPSQSIQPRR